MISDTMKNKVKPRAIKWILKHPNALTWSREQIAKELKRIGIYSQKTYVKDIRVERIIREALLKMSVDERDR